MDGPGRFDGTRPQTSEVQHSIVRRREDLYCGHVRQGGLYRFAGDELVLGYYEAPCAYRSAAESEHGHTGYHGRARLVLDRSFDGGRSWSWDDRVVVHDATLPLEQKQERLFRNPYPRGQLDMSGPDAAYLFGSAYAGDPTDRDMRAGAQDADKVVKGEPELVQYVIRSTDRCRTWEKHPLVIPPPPRAELHRFSIANPPVTRLDDGTVLQALSISPRKRYGEVVLYATQDDGMSWQYVSRVAEGDPGAGNPAYPTLVRLGDGRLLCVLLQMGMGRFYAACVTTSWDGGVSWDPARPIVRLGHSPWRAFPADRMVEPYQAYWRSPCAILLRDGRVLVLYARRWPPAGIGGMLSADGGESWSDEFVLRADGSSYDLGYPLVTELDDGTLFTAYYYTSEPDKPLHEQVRHIAGTHFRVQ